MLKDFAKPGEAFLKQQAERAKAGATVLGDAITEGFAAAFSGKGIGGAFKGFGDSILGAIGGIFEKQGEAMIAASGIFDALLPALSNPFTSGPALFAAGAALVALGATLSAISHGAGSGGAGGGTGGGYTQPTSTQGYAVVAPYQPAPGATATTKGMTPSGPVVVNATIIGPDDPQAQRQITKLMQRAQLRYGGM